MNMPLMDDLRRVLELADQVLVALSPGPARILQVHLAIRLRYLVLEVMVMDRRRDAEIRTQVRKRVFGRAGEMARAIRVKCGGCRGGESCRMTHCPLFRWRGKEGINEDESDQ